MSSERFSQVVREAIISLARDLRAVLRLVEDADLDDDDRTLAAGAVLHVLSAQNAIPGMRGLLAYVDDALVLRLAVERINAKAPDIIARHESEESLIGTFKDDLAATRAFLGDLVAVLEKSTDQVKLLKHEGHTAKQCATNEESLNWLYDSVIEASVKLDFDPDEVARAVKQIDQVVPPLKMKAR